MDKSRVKSRLTPNQSQKIRSVTRLRSGDLTKRLVIPALYNLSRTKILPEHFALIGMARAEGTAESWRDGLYETPKSFVGNATSELSHWW